MNGGGGTVQCTQCTAHWYSHIFHFSQIHLVLSCTWWAASRWMSAGHWEPAAQYPWRHRLTQPFTWRHKFFNKLLMLWLGWELTNYTKKYDKIIFIFVFMDGWLSTVIVELGEKKKVSQYCGSMTFCYVVPMTYGSCCFCQWPSKCQKKFFGLLLFEGTSKALFKDKKS